MKIKAIISILICALMCATVFAVATNVNTISNDGGINPIDEMPNAIDGIEPIQMAADYDWDKYGVVLDIGGTGEDLYVYGPSVLKNADGSYTMWYTGDGDDGLRYRQRIFRASSVDGISWTRDGMVLDYGGPNAQNGVYYPNVLVDTVGTYHMWYSGINSGNKASILHATSADEGITWVKLGQEVNYGTPDAPDGVSTPFVYFDGAIWHMWYSGITWSTPDHSRICHAHKATLASSWIKDGIVLNNNGTYDFVAAASPTVIPTSTGYEMFYSGTVSLSGPSRILHATSPDGLIWTRTGIAMEGTLPLETNQIGVGTIIKDGDTYKVWYSGYDGSQLRIFYAETVDNTNPIINITSPLKSDPQCFNGPITVTYDYIEDNPYGVTFTLMNMATGYIWTSDILTTGFANGKGSNTFTPSPYPPEGTYTVIAIMYDTLDQTGSDFEADSIVLDYTVPVIDLTSPTTGIPASANPDDNLTIEYLYTEIHATRVEVYIYDFINNPSNPVVASYTFTSGWTPSGTASCIITLPSTIAPGTYSIGINMYDCAGNTGTTSFDIELNSLIVA